MSEANEKTCGFNVRDAEPRTQIKPKVITIGGVDMGTAEPALQHDGSIRWHVCLRSNVSHSGHFSSIFLLQGFGPSIPAAIKDAILSSRAEAECRMKVTEELAARIPV